LHQPGGDRCPDLFSVEWHNLYIGNAQIQLACAITVDPAGPKDDNLKQLVVAHITHFSTGGLNDLS
jgi:hypothetical protein